MRTAKYARAGLSCVIASLVYRCGPNNKLNEIRASCIELFPFHHRGLLFYYCMVLLRIVVLDRLKQFTVQWNERLKRELKTKSEFLEDKDQQDVLSFVNAHFDQGTPQACVDIVGWFTSNEANTIFGRMWY